MIHLFVSKGALYGDPFYHHRVNNYTDSDSTDAWPVKSESMQSKQTLILSKTLSAIEDDIIWQMTCRSHSIFNLKLKIFFVKQAELTDFIYAMLQWNENNGSELHAEKQWYCFEKVHF